jgi:hypothetical protein
MNHRYVGVASRRLGDLIGWTLDDLVMRQGMIRLRWVPGVGVQSRRRPMSALRTWSDEYNRPSFLNVRSPNEQSCYHHW